MPTVRVAPTSADAVDVVLALSFAGYGAAAARGFCFPEDRLALALAAHPRVRRLLVCDPVRSVAGRVLRDVQGSEAPYPASARARLHRPLRLRRSDPRRVASARRAATRHERSLRRAAARMGLHRPVVFADHPALAGFGDFGWAGPVTYYAWDDWLELGALRPWWPVYEAAFAGIRARGRRVVAVSEAALRRIDPTGPHAVVPNGVDAAEWRVLPPAPPWFEALPSPRLLYVGSLQSRVDAVALGAIADAFPDGSIVLVGPLLEPGHFAGLTGRANVHVHPRVDRATVAALVGAADVCLLAHVASRLTEAMSPLKLYEYLAGGAPVVATDLPPVRGVDDHVVLVEPGGDFPGAVRRALALGRAGEPRRRAFVEAHAWPRRHERILALAIDGEVAPP